MRYVLLFMLVMFLEDAAMAQPTYVGVDISSTQSTSTITHTVPSGWSAGDLAIAHVDTGLRTVSSAPSGWALAGSITGTAANTYIYTKTLEAGDLGGSIGWTLNASPTGAFIALIRMTGHDTVTPVNVIDTVDDVTTVTDHTFPTVTTTADNCVVFHSTSHGGQNFSVGSGSTGTERNNAAPLILYSQTKASAGAVGTATYTTTLTRRQSLITFAIAPAASSGPAINPITSSIPGTPSDPIRGTIP